MFVWRHWAHKEELLIAQEAVIATVPMSTMALIKCSQCYTPLNSCGMSCFFSTYKIQKLCYILKSRPTLDFQFQMAGPKVTLEEISTDFSLLSVRKDRANLIMENFHSIFTDEQTESQTDDYYMVISMTERQRMSRPFSSHTKLILTQFYGNCSVEKKFKLSYFSVQQSWPSVVLWVLF